LRPLFPAKPAPPFRGEAIVIGDDLVRGSAKEAAITLPREGLHQCRDPVRIAASSSVNGVRISSAHMTKRFPSRCASAIQIVRP
jgi:hypothetical protein